MKKNSIWITWENQRRNRELSKALGIKLFELSEVDQIKSRFKKYVIGITKTLKIYIRERPNIVFCQNPSLILSLFFVLLKKLAGIKVVVDAHNGGLFPKEGRSLLLGHIARFVQRKADLTVVTNESLKKHVESNGGRGFVLPDKIPNIPITIPKKLKGRVNLLFICSYADDEPYEIVFKAAQNISPEICIYVTGNYQKKGIQQKQLPDNVVLTGFIPEDEYIEMLNSVDATIVLTSRENCLVCGAYETVAVEKPMILSNTNALKHYFSKGTIYTENTIEGLESAISDLLRKKDELNTQVRELKISRETDWQKKKEELEKRFFNYSE